MHKHLLTLGLLAALPLSAMAEEPAGDAPPHWSGTGELGLAVSKGNTDSETLVGKLAMGYEDAAWRHAAGASFLYGRSDDVENAYRYEFFADSGYNINDRSYVFGSIRNERDHFASNEYQWTAALGYGYEAIESETTHLTFEIGPGYRWAKLQGVRIHNNEAIVRGTMDFSHQFTATTSLHDALLVEAGSDNTFIRNDIGLKVKMTEALALKAGLETRHNTDVLPGTKKTDTLTTINVAYDF